MEKLFIYAAGVIILIIIIASFPMFVSNCSGDICGSDVLAFPLLQTKKFCETFGGSYKEDATFPQKIKKHCFVINSMVCSMRGGKIFIGSTDGLSVLTLNGQCVKK